LTVFGFESPLVVAVIVAVSGLATIPWLLRQPTTTRIALGLVYLGLYTVALGREGILPFQPAAAFQAEVRLLVQALQLFWWFIFARCLIAIGRIFLLYKHKLHERKFASDLLAGFVYLAVCFTVTGMVFDAPVTGLLATSGVVAIVLGLALQSTVSDLFSGIALSLERPYRIGDSIGLEGGVEGTVTEISWRATHIMTSSQDDLVVPNSVVAKSRIVNHSFPVRVHGVQFEVLLDHRTSPGRGIEILEHALLHCRSVLRQPAPQVRTSHLDAASIGYSVSFFVDRFEAAAKVKSDVLGLIHRHAEWGGASLGRATPDASVAQPNGPMNDHARVAKVLDRVSMFAELPLDERETLGAVLTRRSVIEGEPVFEQGQTGDSLFLIEAGVVAVTRANESGIEEEISRLGPGDFFGASAVLTGEPRTATARALVRATLYEIRKDSLAPLLEQHGELRNHLARRGPPHASPDRTAPMLHGAGAKPRASLIEHLAHLFNAETGI
jgi:small-conductance mechanosensitive channel